MPVKNEAIHVMRRQAVEREGSPNTRTESLEPML